MAYTSGFFDAVDQGGGDYDRVYSAATFAHYFSLLVQNGVFPDPSTGMQVKASSNPDMHVSIQPGSGWVNGYYITVEANAPEQLTVPTANPSLSRIDSVIMGLNYVDREVQLYIKSGAVSASPSAVSLQRDNDLYELELAQITVSAGMASITQASITDMRSNTSRCGIVKGMIDQIDTTDLFAQYDAEFQEWFADIKAQLSGDVATNLQNQINNLKIDKVNVSDKASTIEAQAGTNDAKWMTPLKLQQFLTSKLATTSEAKLGTNTTKVMTAEKTLEAIKFRRWHLLASYKTPQSFTYTVPSGISQLGAVVMGGGASGGCGAREVAIGGAGGQVEQFVMDVTEGQQIAGVVGIGGPAKNWTSSGTGGVTGNDGGTSSFNGVTAAGGTASKGGQGPTLTGDTVGAAGGVIDGDNYGLSQVSSKLINLFDPGKILSASGGNPPFGIRGKGDIAGGVSDYGSGGTGRSTDYHSTRDTTADAATGNGCGGGGAYNYNFLNNSIGNCVLVSGAGSPGMVLIYGR